MRPWMEHLSPGSGRDILFIGAQGQSHRLCHVEANQKESENLEISDLVTLLFRL